VRGTAGQQTTREKSVTATAGAQVFDVLDEAECRRLLPTVAIGRIGYTEGALQAIQPVSFGVHGDQVLIPTRTGSKVAAASRGAVVAFEVDSFDAASRTGR
jgi:nitroimidazol reductase NimA-like FMN-containing flavoprotein (pyridoxamine 5'-phosphate oxidase superfamily)